MEACYIPFSGQLLNFITLLNSVQSAARYVVFRGIALELPGIEQ